MEDKTYKEWRKIGTLKSGEDVYHRSKTRQYGVEKKFLYLVQANVEELQEIVTREYKDREKIAELREIIRELQEEILELRRK